MSRTLFGIGSHGGIVGDIQRALASAGFDPGKVDEVYGQGTASAVKKLQMSRGAPQTGEVDDLTWVQFMPGPVPSLFRRALELSAAFEGHSYGLAVGDFDGAWLTWGIIGFTMKFGKVQEIILKCNQNHPELIREALGVNAEQLIAVMRDTSSAQKAWGDSVSINGRLAAPWRQQFQVLGDFDEVRQIQRQLAHDEYFLPCLDTARTFRLKTELGIALCFDIHVQNGSINSTAKSLMHDELVKTPSPDEPRLRKIIANAVADAANAVFREDVRSRKMALATGHGLVHGTAFDLDDWGLGEFVGEMSALTQTSAA
jgi:Putative peptidoglycan binding domain/Glycosyl hydrolase family 46